MQRRFFLKNALCATGLAITPSTIFADIPSKYTTVKIVGDLDDDLFVMRADSEDWKIEDCYQMHNRTKRISLEGKHFDAIHSPGYIEFQKDYELEEN